MNDLHRAIMALKTAVASRNAQHIINVAHQVVLQWEAKLAEATTAETGDLPALPQPKETT